MSIHLEELSEENFQAVIDLQVADNQREFIETNLYSIAQARIEQELNPLCIYEGNQLVGFCMYGIDEEDGRAWILRCMVDKAFQGKGYASGAIKLLVQKIKDRYNVPAVYASYPPENKWANKLFEKSGFIDTGKIENKEKLVKLSL